ncbi:MAG: hypothetical protein Q8N23_33385 [Archangium sp.]|nr:hypothetical protein [Archangium sp.]MDP3572011.1 hypothetical protein [Archangium sp.]
MFALVIGVRRGVDLLARKDPDQARALSRWLDQVRVGFAGRTLEVTEQVAEEWSRLGVPTLRPVVDGLLAATAKVHSLIVVTRNTSDFGSMGVDVHNPFKR